MITTIDEDRGEVIVRDGVQEVRHKLASAEGFAAASRAWLRAGWDAKYVYSFTWLGRPIIQLPEDMFRLQELIWEVKPDVIIETGVAHGGGMVFYASLLEIMGQGKVIGIDVEVRPHNREALKSHRLWPRMSLIEGSSTSPAVSESLDAQIHPDDRVLVVLDSNHTKAHVLSELTLLGERVSLGSYIVATDGIMSQLGGAPRTSEDWAWNNPLEAIGEFVAQDARFVVEEPKFAFNEGLVSARVTYWPDAYIKRIA